MKLLIGTVVLVALAVTIVRADNCGGNCPSDDCPAGDCVCGDSTNYVDPSTYCQTYTGWSEQCCECIANAESGGNTNAVNYNDDGSTDAGLFQINSVNWNDCSGGNAPCGPNTNTGCAIKVWQWGGSTWSLWSTCGACGCCNSP